MSSIGVGSAGRYATCVPDPHELHGGVELRGVANFRDVGGLPTIDGGAVASRRLFRSAALHHASPADLVTLHDLEVTLNIDLRDPAEIAYTGRGALETDPIGFSNLSLSYDRLMERPVDPDAGLVPLAQRYRDYLDQGPHSIVAALAAMANVSNHAVLVNCFFGKDRTGVLIAIALEALGVERGAIVEDYARSAGPVESIVQGLLDDPVYADTIAHTDPSRLAADPDTMVDFLSTLDDRDGGAVAWLTRAGLSPATLNELRRVLVVH